jgi:hypothetical protein
MRKQFTNLTGLASNSGKIRMICPICETDFVRPVAWAKRVNVNYCGRGCAAIGHMVRVECFCRVCQASMMLTPTDAEKKTTCGPVCSSIRKRSRGVNSRKSSWAAYRRAMKEIADRAVCEKCGTTVGPWVVRGLRVDVIDGNTPSASSESASLWCKHCHLVDAAPLGPPEREKRKMTSNAI